MRKQKIKRGLFKGGGGGGGSNARMASKKTSPIQKTSRTSTNKADKSTWNSPPGTDVKFYEGKRVKGMVTGGAVHWTLDGSIERASGKVVVPAQELKDLKRAWNEYLKSPNANQLFIASVSDSDGAGKTRERVYKSLGFKIIPSPMQGGDVDLELDNRKRK